MPDKALQIERISTQPGITSGGERNRVASVTASAARAAVRGRHRNRRGTQSLALNTVFQLWHHCCSAARIGGGSLHSPEQYLRVVHLRAVKFAVNFEPPGHQWYAEAISNRRQ